MFAESLSLIGSLGRKKMEEEGNTKQREYLLGGTKI